MTPLATDLSGLLRLVILSVTAPRMAARYLVATELSRAVLWQVLLLVTLLSVLLVAITQGPMPDLPPDSAAPISITPFAYTVILGASLVMLVFGLYFTGQSLGGTGSFPATLAIVIWMEVLGMAIRVMLAVVTLIAPMITGIAAIIAFGVLLWVLVNFLSVLHDFQSIGKAVLTLVLAVVGISIGITLILTIIGVSLTGGSLNV